MTLEPLENVTLGARTTLEIGGPARWFVEAESEDEVVEALEWADAKGVPLHVLGGGSNVLIADAGLEALVLHLSLEGIRYKKGELLVAAGESWDGFVAYTVERGFAGVECLSGIPGDVGAAPMQNIGAYGQEVASTITSVRCVRRSDGEIVELDRDACAFGYRDSVFKGEARDRYVVTEVRFGLELNGAPSVAYADLERAMLGRPRTLALVRDTVVELRAEKSMVIDPEDPNHRSAGSFFVNPVLDPEAIPALEVAAERAAPGQVMPRFDTDDGRVKVPAAWLIERSGLKKGTVRGRVGLSSKHCLAIINRGGASASEVVSFAAEIRERVRETFGVSLTPEPRLLGFDAEVEARLLG